MVLFPQFLDQASCATIDCRNQQCLSITQYCPDDEDCFIDCAFDEEACQDAIFHCPSNGKCNVNCDGSESCDRAKILATSSMSLDIKCSDARESCKQMDVHCPNMVQMSNQATCNITGYNANNPDGMYTFNITKLTFHLTILPLYI